MNDITIFMPLSGRWQYWPRRLEWLRRQRHPRQQISLAIADCNHRSNGLGGLFENLDLLAWKEIRYYQQDVGRSGLADDPARNYREVYDAIAAIYHKAIQETQTRYLLILEDDVFADDPRLIPALLEHPHGDVISVSVAYPHREQPHNFCCWDERHQFVARRDVAPGVREVAGHGFGCCLLDTEKAKVALDTIFDPERQHFDRDFFDASKYRSLVDFSIPAEHLFA